MNKVKFQIKSDNYISSNVEITYAIPSFNHGKYIGELLTTIYEDLVLNSFTYEILIVDDGSVDETKNEISNFISQHPNVFIKAMFFDNAGISNNLNRIVNESKGEFIRLCASDDLIVPSSTYRMLKKFEHHNYCVVGDGEVISENGHVLFDSLVEYHAGNKPKLLSAKHNPYEIVNNYSFAGPCLLVRKAFYDLYSYDKKSQVDDYDFFVSLVTLTNLNAVKFFDEKVCMYRVHKTNTSKTQCVRARLKNQKSMLYLAHKFLNRKCRGFKIILAKKILITLLKILYLKILLLVEKNND
tara:strand:+ start:14493 stop:15386 length:894 start_codon:yes stop_codon:yes gene_type:complete